MATLKIDGVGEVSVEDAFLSLPPETQAAEVDAIATSIKSQPAPKPDDIVKRGKILPLGRTAAGDIVPALPEPVEGFRQIVMDLLQGKVTADQVSGKQMLDIITTLGLIPGTTGAAAAGTGAGVTRAAATKEAAAAAPKVEPPLAAPAAPTAAPPVAAPVAPVAERAAVEAVPKTAAEFKEVARPFYKAAEESGVVIKPERMKALSDDVFTTTSNKGLDPTLTPDSLAAIKRIKDLENQPVSFQTLDLLRQIASDAGASQKPSDRRVAGIIVEKLDDFIANLKSSDTIIGDTKIASEAILKARDLWSKGAKLELIERMVENAKTSAPSFSGSGLENALRTEFKNLARNQNKMRTFTPEERQAITLVARGNAARLTARGVGKFAPTGVVSTVLSGGTGAALGGGIGAVALPAAGFAARQVATALIKRHIRQLEATIRSGGNSQFTRSAIQRGNSLIEELSGAASVVAPSAAGEQARRK